MKFHIPDTTKTKMKLMLWIEKATVKKLKRIHPPSITTQECIRQILEDYIKKGNK